MPHIFSFRNSNYKQYHTKMKSTRSISKLFLFLFTVTLCSHLIVGIHGAEEDCPWYQDARISDTIKSRCICARNPSSNNQLSVQCHEVDGQQLISILLASRGGSKEPLELLYLNGSQVTDANGQLPAGIFRELKLISLQFSGCSIKSLHPDAFRGQENHLKHLSLSQNQLTEVPTAALDRLSHLTLLELSYNKITEVQSNAFENLNKLSTLKLNDNNLELESHSFKGLENSLRNLNLKGTRISSIPEAISNLSSLAFLDLAQNRLRDLDPLPFIRLHSLTALNLERNLLQRLPNSVFSGVNDTLSSLSLLNNLITHFPKEALHSLRELRVLDLGFNLLTEIPEDAFTGLQSLTLLALDGNPLATLKEESFAQLNTTLRGLSLGGRFLNCDCRIRWVAEWIREYDLQVTSRERNPQFCGSPLLIRNLNFYQIKTEDFVCEQNDTSSAGNDDEVSPGDLTIGLSPKLMKSSKESEDSAAGEDDVEEAIPEENSSANIRINQTVPTPRFRKPTRLPLSRERARLSSSYESEEEESGENGGEDNSSNFNPAEHSSDNIRPITYKPSTRYSTLTTKPTTTTTIPVTRKAPQPNKPFQITRPKVTPKILTSTTTSTSVSTSISTVSANNSSEVNKIYVSNRPAVSPKPKVIQPDPIQVRRPSIAFENGEIDESKIPVITGVGQSRASSIPNSGSVIPVKIASPPAIQTQGAIQVQPQSPHHATHHQVPNSPSGNNRPPNMIFAEKSEILLKDIERATDSIILQWDSQKQLAGFRIIYRFFGEDTFRHGPPLAPTEREYRIKNIPNNECLVVCVVPYDDIVYNEINPSAATIPPGSQCRELKPSLPSALMNHMDKITIGASAAICATVLLAVIIFIAITKRSKGKRPPSAMMTKVPPASLMSPSPGPAMVTPGSLSLIKEWDQLSAVSARSIPRARVYHGTMDGIMVNGTTPRNSILPMHSHSQSQRSIPDGHSTHRSYLSSHHAHHNHSMHSYNHHPTHIPTHSNTSAAVNSYLNNQSRLLRASLGSRSSQDALNKQLGPSSHVHRHFEQNQKRRRAGRLSQSDSLNTLSGYETPDNWTDHDMDVYVARNATRHDLVQL